jgi:nucleoside-diphosphate-sugar epimerase
MLEVLLGRTVDTVRRQARPAEVRDSWADIVESARLLGYRPRVTVEEGLRRTAEASIDTSDDLFDAVGPGHRR